MAPNRRALVVPNCDAARGVGVSYLRVGALATHVIHLTLVWQEVEK
jgi:hypothetical protein